LTGNGGGPNGNSTNIYIHDLVDINGDRGNLFGNQQDIQFALWNTFWTYLSFENILCQDCGGYMFRGASDPTGYGPLRFKNIGWIARGNQTPGGDGAGAVGAKVWGPGNGFEWVDNKWDFNVTNWTSGDYHYSYCMSIGLCAQNVDIINNEFINCETQALTLHPDAGSSFCQWRPLDNINILRNIFRQSSALQNSCCRNFVYLQGARSGSPSTAYVNNVTIADNFFSTTQTGTAGYTSAFLLGGGRNGSAPAGTINIVNNTINGKFQANNACGGCRPGVLVTDNSDDDVSGFPYNNITIKDNVISGLSSTAPSRALNVRTNPSNFRADNNAYDPQSTFIWNDGVDMNFATWRSNLGGCPGTDKDCNSLGSCVPSYVNASNGDLHLNVSDTCARSHGANLSSMPLPSGLILLDIDGDSRPRSLAWDVGADEAGLLLAAPRLLEVVPLP